VVYGHLGGCVRDVLRVQDFLTSRLGVPADHITTLTATNNGGAQPQEPAAQWPTYENIITGFRQLTTMAAPGDQVFIHYSGHGGRATTAYPDLKGTNEHDEALVPTDIGTSEDRYVRDLFLAERLQEMVDKKLNVTLVLDSCHSGGATRGGRATARGIGRIDTSQRTPLLGEKERQSQIANWQGAMRHATRNVKPDSGWLPEPQGYTLLAACRGTELAYEDTFTIDGVPTRSGALTYALLDALSNLGAGLTYKMLHDRVVAKVHAYFDLQTPMLHGDGTRTVFGIEQARSTYRVNVRQVDAANRRVQLDAGQSGLLRAGAQFAIYPPTTLDAVRSARRLAIVTVTDVGAVDAWAEITEELVKEPIEQGAQALLFNPGSTRLQRTVGTVVLKDLPGSIDQERALQAVVDALKANDSSFVRLVEDGATADFLISLNKEGNYVIGDNGNQPLPNLRPPLSIADPDAAKTVVERLIHLTQYRNVRELGNYDDSSPLSNKLKVEVCRLPPDYQRGDKPELIPFDLAAGPPTVKAGQYFAVRIKNLLPELPPAGADPVRNDLNITVLDLQPDWGISQIYPSDGAPFLPLDAQREVVRIFKAGLPQGYQQGTDVVKVFATIGTTDFRWLTLSALDQPRSAMRSAFTKPKNGLEELLAAINERGGGPTFRNAFAVTDPSTEWVTEQVEVTVVA
jgi:hypothetical protein